MQRTKRKCNLCDKDISSSNYIRHYQSCKIKHNLPIKEKYTRTKKKCDICNREISLSNFNHHVQSCQIKHNLPVTSYKTYIIWNKGKTKETNSALKQMSETKKRNYENGVPHSWIGKKHSAESKLKMSESRKKWLQENPEKHPWKKLNKHESEPCNVLKRKLLDNNITFVEEYQPLQERAFSIDIAFPDKKIGIEVNGNQHYNEDNTLKEYYQNRHDLIEQDGWTLIELHYLDVYSDDIIKTIKSILL